MNLSLRGRVTTSFIIANVVVLALTFIVFHYLNSLNKDIESITFKSNKVSLITDEVRISAVAILKYQRRVLTSRPSQEQVDKIINLCESFTAQLQRLDALYQDAEVKTVVVKMLTYVDSLKLHLSKAALFDRRGDQGGMSIIGDLADKILDTFSEFQDIQYNQSIVRDKKIKSIINETKRQMMIVLIIGFLFTIILALVVPGKIALPFKKIKDAIRELQDCNFDVSIYYNQDDEIGEIAREMNKMIHSFKVFDELRTDRVSVENRKFDALANMIKRPILVANADGKLIYMNNNLYSLLKVQSEDVIGKDMTETSIPASIVESYELAIKRRSKIENAEITIPMKKVEKEQNLEADYAATSPDVLENESISTAEIKEVEKEEPEYIYKGYANVIPIRGKESSLDYYLMVLSVEVFA